MTTMHTEPVQDSGFTDIFTGGLAAGLFVTLLNNFYSWLYNGLTNFQLPELVHLGTISLASFFSCLVGAICYYQLLKRTSKPKLIFGIIVSIVTLASLAAPLTATMPDGSPVPQGFAGLTIPMHFITALVAALLIPSFPRFFASGKNP